MACCVCGATDPAPFCAARDRLHGVPGEFRYVTCRGCGLIYQNPQVAPEDIPLLYPESYAPWSGAAGAVAAPPVWKRRLRDRIVITGLPAPVRTLLDGGGRLLDVGCGNGRFLARVASEHPAATVEGLDFSAQAVEAVRSVPGVRVHLGTLAERAAELVVRRDYDVVVSGA